MKKVAIAVLLVALSASALSEVEQPQTPAGFLARSAGSFVGATEYIRTFKASECSYSLKKPFPSFDEALRNEVLPSFPPKYRDEVRRNMAAAKPEVSRQAAEYVKELIATAKRQQDKKTACGLAAGTIVGIYVRAREKWLENKAQYGWKAE